jgi:anti-sigma B factor antagonist
MSSSILRVFLLALKTIRRNNGKIILTSLQDHIEEVFDISGFLDLFEIYPTREDAFAAI